MVRLLIKPYNFLLYVLFSHFSFSFKWTMQKKKQQKHIAEKNVARKKVKHHSRWVLLESTPNIISCIYKVIILMCFYIEMKILQQLVCGIAIDSCTAFEVFSCVVCGTRLLCMCVCVRIVSSKCMMNENTLTCFWIVSPRRLFDRNA